MRPGGAPRVKSVPMNRSFSPLNKLDRLESESIHIIREVEATCDKPVLLYSVGKDSSVLLHLALKAFAPHSLPFPLLHIDTGWKFSEMIEFRDQTVARLGLDLVVHTNLEGQKLGITPFSHSKEIYTRVMKTESLKQALDKYEFRAALGGSRRDEELSRAKERVFSFRRPNHVWDPRDQRPELWNLFNARMKPSESVRVFPLSNWTEIDIWHYIYREKIPLVSLYFAAPRQVIERDGNLILIDEKRWPLADGETSMEENVRFRTLGCYPLTGALRSSATNVIDIIKELLRSRQSERYGRVIDRDEGWGSMERKKMEGYF